MGHPQKRKDPETVVSGDDILVEMPPMPYGDGHLPACAILNGECAQNSPSLCSRTQLFTVMANDATGRPKRRFGVLTGGEALGQWLYDVSWRRLYPHLSASFSCTREKGELGRPDASNGRLGIKERSTSVAQSSPVLTVLRQTLAATGSAHICRSTSLIVQVLVDRSIRERRHDPPL